MFTVVDVYVARIWHKIVTISLCIDPVESAPLFFFPSGQNFFCGIFSKARTGRRKHYYLGVWTLFQAPFSPPVDHELNIFLSHVLLGISSRVLRFTDYRSVTVSACCSAVILRHNALPTGLSWCVQFVAQ